MQFIRHVPVRLLLAAVMVAGGAVPAAAGTITLGDWQQFSFGGAGTPAAGCDPADPTGGFCIPSSGTPANPLDTPPWTFDAPLQGVILNVTDAFVAGDRFEIFDFGVSLGTTSGFLAGTDCGDDPAICIATAGMSIGRFVLPAGSHSITITPTASLGGGSAFLQAEAVPEPGSVALLGLGLGALALIRNRMRQREVNQ